ncbi:MAG TPA: aroma-sacti cluster domain-containing protein [Actinospica sp.]|nr:aroma-sacti cluster domain-containing protein [Actinospica sp.]
MPDNLDRLCAAGFAVHAFTPRQRDVLGDLSPEELTLLIDLKARLEDTADDVQAHGDVAGGALF